ncbi:MAG: beta-lactamase family protein [Anaerolineae bacterium]|nr:beta-lactamase family protein [Anaerolineae bacterium]
MSEKQEAAPGEAWERVVACTEAAMKAHGVPGAVVGILHQGEIQATGFGVTNVEHPLPITPDTLFQIGSITKTYTAMAVMRLVEKGTLSLDEPVRTYVPEFRVADEDTSARVTLRHLLTHTAGWSGDLFTDMSFGDEALAHYVGAMAELAQESPLGELPSYNNAAVTLAGHVVAMVTDKTYEAAMQELVLEPLGLKRSFFNPIDVMVHRFVVGHSAGPKGPQVAQPWPIPRAENPCGGLVCDIGDLLRFARFHLGDGTTEDGTRLLSAETMAAMHTPQTTFWDGESMGLTWFLHVTDGVLRVSHGGSTIGQQAELTLVPQHGLAIGVMTNADEGLAVNQDVTKCALREYAGLDVPDPEAIDASPEALARFAGLYTRYMVDLELGMLADQLVGQIRYTAGFPTKDSPPPPCPPPMTLGLCEPDRLLFLNGRLQGLAVDVVRDADGAIDYLRAGYRLQKRVR